MKPQTERVEFPQRTPAKREFQFSGHFWLDNNHNNLKFMDKEKKGGEEKTKEATYKEANNVILT